MDSDDSDSSGLECSPFAKRTLLSPRLMPRSLNAGEPLCSSSSSSERTSPVPDGRDPGLSEAPPSSKPSRNAGPHDVTGAGRTVRFAPLSWSREASAGEGPDTRTSAGLAEASPRPLDSPGWCQRSTSPAETGDAARTSSSNCQDLAASHPAAAHSPPPASAPQKPRRCGPHPRQADKVADGLAAPPGDGVSREGTALLASVAKNTVQHEGEGGDLWSGFDLWQVVVHRAEGENLGVGIVPSCGLTREYYQIKHLVPGGVWTRASSSLAVGDRLLACNGESLKGLTQAQCLQVLKSAGSPLTLTILHQPSDSKPRQHPAADRLLSPTLERPLTPETPLDGWVARDADVLLKGASLLEGGVTSCEHSQDDSEPERAAGAEHWSDSEDTGLSSLTEKLPPAPAFPHPSDITDHVTMSNPFLDDVDAATDSPTGGAARVTNTNPFYQDLLEQDFGIMQPVGGGFSSPPPAFFDFFSDTSATNAREGEELSSVNVLLDFSDGDDRTRSLGKWEGGKIDGDTDMAAANSPPPGELSDLTGIFAPLPAVLAQAPVTNIDDLLGVDFSVVQESSQLPQAAVQTTWDGSSNKGSNGLFDESFDFLVDADEAQQETRTVAHLEGGSPRPPPVPTSTFPGAAPAGGQHSDEHVSAVFLPSNNPADNVSVVPVTGGGVAVGVDEDSGESVVHVTDIIVSNFKPQVSTVTVSAAKPSHSASPTPADLSPPGATKVRLGGPVDAVSARIQFDNSDRGEADGVGPFIPPPGPNKTPRDIEEEILPMAVQRDEQGNRLATPATPQTLKKPTADTRQLNEAAKHDLASVMSEMTKWRPLALGEKDSSPEGRVQEEEIVPVVLTRSEADMAEMVLARWVAAETPDATSPAPRADSAFRRAADSVIQVQTGRADLPENAVFHTTIGVTMLPKAGESGEARDEEEVITPMSVFKDHQGNKHCVPCTTTTTGGALESVPSAVDECAKRDIAAVMATMDTSTRRTKPSRELKAEDGSIVDEDIIERTVLTGEEMEQAMAAVSRWLDKESGIKQTPPSGFQRLVENVMDMQSKEELPAMRLNCQDDVDGKLRKAGQESDRMASRDAGNGTTHFPPDSAAKVSVERRDLASTSEPETNVTRRRPKDTPAQSVPSYQEARARPISADVQARQRSEDSGVDTEQSDRDSSPTYHAQLCPVSRLTAQTRLISGSLPELRPASDRSKGSRPVSMAFVEMRPGAGQRSLRAPARLSMGSSLLSKGGGLALGARSALQPLSLARSSKGEYSKTRRDDAPFLVEVLNGIVGLGVKVAVTPEGLVRVTDIQRNSPVHKNGNLRTGDYILCVNTSELTGQNEGRVQQVFRLLPRGLVKLLVTTQPPTTANESADSSLTPGQGGGYTQFGVRVSPLPFATQPANSSVSAASPLTASPVPDGGGSLTQEPEQTSHATVTAAEDEDADDMAETGGAHRLSKALSPRSWNAPAEAPKPTPRQRAAVAVSVTKISSDSTAEEGKDNSVASPNRPERHSVVSEFVTAAARRPSGRGDDLPAPPDVPQPQLEVGQSTVPLEAEGNAFLEQSDPSTVSVLSASRHPSGGDSLRDEVLPVFAEAAKKLAPTPVPRNKGGNSPKRQEEDAEETTHASLRGSRAEREEVAPAKEEIITTKSTIQCHGASQEAPPVPRVPPPVAPKPSRLPDPSPLPAHADHGAAEVLSPTFVSPRLSEFVDPDVASAEEQLKCRKFVSSAARMFEEKATEQKPAAHATRPIRSSLAINSVIQSFNKEAEAEPLMMRKASPAVASSPDSKPINSALLPARDKRKSTPLFSAVPLSGLTKPASLTQPKEIATTGRVSDTKRAFAQKVAEQNPPERAARVNAALQPRHSPQKHERQEDQGASLPPHVGKAEHTRWSVKSPSRSSVHSVHEHDSLEHLSSLSASAQEPPDDAKQPRMVFSSRSLHQGDRRSWCPSTSSAWQGDGSDVLGSTMRQFDDLLSDKHTLESDIEHLRVSNNVSLDLESWHATRGTGRSKPKEVQADHTCSSLEESSAADNLVDSKSGEQKAGETDSSASLSKPEILRDESFAAAAQVPPAGRKKDEAENMDITEVIHSTAIQWLNQKKTAAEKVNDSGQEMPGVFADQSEPQVTRENNSDDVVYRVVKVQVHRSPEMLNDIITKKAIIKRDEKPHEDEREDVDNVKEESPPIQDEEKDQEMDSPQLESASEDILEQHASALVETVLKNALHNVASSKSRDFDRREATLSPPTLPEEEPPPLPGAPPPPLILRNKANVLVTAADLEEMLQPSEADREFTDLDKSPRCNQPVSDTVSVDSGVLDEDMPEDSLRFTQDDSPTTSGEPSTFELPITPDEIIASVVSPADSAPSSHQIKQDHSLLAGLADQTGGKVFKGVSDLSGNGAAKVDVSLSHQSPVTKGVCVSPKSQHTFTAIALEERRFDDFSDSDISNLQDSHSLKCSSVPQVLEAVPHGGASTTGSDVITEAEDLRKSLQAVRNASDKTCKLVQNDEQNQSSAILSSGVVGNVTPAVSENETSSKPNSREATEQVISLDQKPPKLMSATEEDFVEIVSPRTLHFLDPSGSLFLQCPANSPVSLSSSTLGQVSSLHPRHLVELVAKANDELSSAKLPTSLELKLVAARSLDGGSLQVDVTQREDYFVQVTRVKSSRSSVQEADLLLSVDGHTMRHKRPAQVQTALEDTDHKSLLMIARGLKLKAPLIAEGGSGDEKASSPLLPSSSAPKVTTVGVFDVVMMKGPTGVGFCLEGGKASPLGDLPIVIKRIFKGGPAEKCGNLKVKDEILAVNGIDFTNMRHYEAWNHLKFLDDGEIRITIRRK